MNEVLEVFAKLLNRERQRFINVETIQLHTFSAGDVRLGARFEYATLSHTWGQHEATYQEWDDAQTRQSDGIKKIRDACKVVKESLGLQWLWIDTCCINKADEDEVYQAVNKTFSLYQGSTVCLAYLSDVPTANTDNNELLSSQVRNSRWFTRGWTLPELLAPKQLIFYAADWTVLGQRDDSLAELISEVTNIDQAYLSGRRDVQQASVSKRMSWMSNRRTTRAEDMVYCMLGILDIEMDIHYGEGKGEAMGRLIEEIEQKARDKKDSPKPPPLDPEQGRSYMINVKAGPPPARDWYRPELGPSADRHITTNTSQYNGGSDESPSVSMFDFSIQSGGTQPSTVPTSAPLVPPRVSGTAQKADLSPVEKHKPPSDCLDDLEDLSILIGQHTGVHEESDTATIYSIETLADDPKLHYFQVFVDQLAEDVRTGAEGMVLKDLGPDNLDHALKEFAWKLYEESSNPFQLETSVIIHRKRRNVVDLLDFEYPQFEISESESEQSSAESDVGDDGFLTEVPFRKAEETIVAWIGDINPDPASTTDLSQMPQYRQFIQESSAYRWLLTKLKQHNRLTCEKPNIMDEIGVVIRNRLKNTESLRKMSRNRAPVPVEMTYTVNWNLLGFMRDRGIPSPFAPALPNILCLTGTWDEVQATSVIEYMDQTWPQSGKALIALLQTLLSALEEEDETGAMSGHAFNLGNLEVRYNRPSLYIKVTGGQYLVSEVGEQIAWLVSALQVVPGSPDSFTMSFPGILDLAVHSPSRKGKRVGNIRASCTFGVDWRQPTVENVPLGGCWRQLFGLPVIVHGYPILRRSVPKSGLEISLKLVASIMGSNQVVQLDNRLLIKGFNMLMIATLVAADIMVWHLFISEKGGQRISYMDSRLDELNAMPFDEVSLHHIPGKRHIVGWCTKATDWCGSPSTNHNIRPAGLPRSPASLKIDKLYIEGGATVTGGFMMDINKKEQPFWLQREKDYPDLLNWVKLRPIVFYDVEERRAWLVDGASALLHLVRISLHQDTNDTESAYDWVYDSGRLKDNWPGVGGRQAAVNTLKNWDNRALGLHIIGKRPGTNGVLVPEYSTFEDRVKKILHSIEILIDQQEKAASQDGFKISQTWDPRRDIIGFEIMDVIGPSGPIYSRVQRINSWGRGWTDLAPSIGLTTIFGRGFGNLIQADEPSELCPNWRLVPSGKDFLVASVSTIKMLYEKQLLKLEPGRSEDEIAKRVTIVAAKETSNPCNCLKQQGSNSNHLSVVECHHKPVQFLTKRWWLLGALPNGLVPVRLGSLPVRGAVILGHTVLGLSSKDASTSRQPDDDGSGSTATGGSLQATGSSSDVTEMTAITTPSVGPSSQEASGGGQSSNSASKQMDGTRNKRWSRFKDWVKK
ncbi:Ff.00g131800.m01.CDS01 [Fusarium sp. VM40]|nr:Ff.00g131800.m01.CDS01 [Fusarium sp. VM40]